MSHNTIQTRVILSSLVLCCLLICFLYYSLYIKDSSISPNVPSDVELVVARLKQEDTSWLDQYFPHWKKSIYTVDDPTAALTVPKNKGRESMVYLTYIIDNYEHLPAYSLFMHSQRFQWHNDDPDYDGVPLLRSFQFPYLREQGYVNMRCVWALGCPDEINPFEDEASETLESSTTIKAVFRRSLQQLLPYSVVPSVIGVSCCAQFAVTRERIRSRPRQDYIRMREWLLNSPLEDEVSGRVFEYSWHIIFGVDAVHCPSAGDCYCKVYGMCDMQCDEDQCDGRYTLPEFAILPEGWPYIGWDGELRNFTGPM